MAFPTGYTQYDQITIDKTKVGSGGVTNIDVWLPLSRLSTAAQSTLRIDGGDARFTLNDGTTRIANDIIGKIESSNQALDSTDSVGTYTSIAVDGMNVFICYYDSTNGNLKFIKSSDSGAIWGTPQILDSTGVVGQHISIVVSGTNVFISYYDATNGNLKFIKSSDSGATWGTPQILDSTGSVGRFTSIAVSGINLFVSYYDYTNSDLKFIKSSDSGATWGTPQILDSTGSVGTDTSIAVNGANVFISYNDATNGNLKFVKSGDSGATWGTPQTLDSTGSVGKFTSIAVSGTNVFISYNDGTDYDLKFIKSSDSGTTWGTPQILDFNGITGEHTSIIVNGTNVFIGYYSAYSANVKVITSKDSGVTWNTPETLDTTVGTGQYTSIATDGMNLFASYYNNVNTELRFAKKSIGIAGFRVNIPMISDTTDTVIRCWYNGIDTQQLTTDTYGQYATYNGVSLYSSLESDPAGVAPQMLDRTSNANHGTVSGGVTSVAGQVGNAASFNGSTGSVGFGTSTTFNLGTSDFSVSCWFKTATTGKYRGLALKINSVANYAFYGFYIGSDNKLYAGAVDCSANACGWNSTRNPLISTASVTDGVWHRACYVRSGTNQTLYIDGVSVATQTEGPFNTDNAGAFTVGLDTATAGSYLDGEVDNVRIDSVARSAARIMTAYNNENNPGIFFSNVTASTGGGSTPPGTRQFPVIGSTIIHGPCR